MNKYIDKLWYTDPLLLSTHVLCMWSACLDASADDADEGTQRKTESCTAKLRRQISSMDELHGQNGFVTYPTNLSDVLAR